MPILGYRKNQSGNQIHHFPFTPLPNPGYMTRPVLVSLNVMFFKLIYNQYSGSEEVPQWLIRQLRPAWVKICRMSCHVLLLKAHFEMEIDFRKNLYGMHASMMAYKTSSDPNEVP